ncbi:lactoylglutathione lyase [Leptospira levettii]|uniref:Aldoketomutase n=1 Tax=Leptospira levettii TaxID=2023178 RepID=A0A5F2DAQ9_9LEPT|nr:VOC family protein [Leptospira levettii]PKA25549.1 lactoylglutathione lyase [Leptospira sp. mixed culture ATI2-C-A1]MCW7464722.1 VOC family protein [Leptospira levettii]MCW7495211.1 VOC family protein [Leptospira levettii]MCW7508045.1 VOC family protein [Leptospira levettii]MCW7511094.1 VOC family protein [Leptospira levettii]
MKYLHTMIRVQNLEKALHFFVDILGLKVSRQKDYPEGKFTLVFVSTEENDSSEIELTYNWDQTEPYSVGRNFGHLAYEVENIYETCEKIQSMGVVINRPPRDGRMAFVRSPDLISIELLQKGNPLPPKEPWVSMPNTGEW